MKNPELYHKTVDILVQAYFNDTLVHGNGCGCAVGNIIAARMGLRVVKKYNDDVVWSDGTTGRYVAWNNRAVNLGIIDYEAYRESEKAQKQIAISGYLLEEIAVIERAFENSPTGNSDDEWMFNGLMAVIEALDIIHDNTDSEVTTTSKSRFNKQLA